MKHGAAPETDADVLVIGAGAAGAHAALALAEAGVRVAMIDDGRAAAEDAGHGPDRNFEDVRRNDPAQHRWFLGEDWSGIPLREEAENGTDGDRAYAATDAECAYLGDRELAALGLPGDALAEAYEDMTARIGIAGPQDRPGILEPLRPDHHAEALLRRAADRAGELRRQRCSVRQTHLAVLTRRREDWELRGRLPYAYTDMECFADPRRSVYHPRYTLEELETHPAFTRHRGWAVERVEEDGRGVRVHARTVDGKITRTFSAQSLVLAAGAVDTARILLRSRGLYGVPVPLLSNGRVLAACLRPAALGDAGPRGRSSLCQVAVTDEVRTADGLHAGQARLYGYRALQLLRLLPDAKAPLPEALGLLALLSPALVIADMRFPAAPSPDRTLLLQEIPGADRVRLSRGADAAALEAREDSILRLRRALRTLGLHPLKTVRHAEGAASHYAGTVPVAEEGEAPLTVDASCKLRGSDRIWVADASVFRRLPAHAHTLTVMANARRVGGIAAAALR